MRNYQKIYSNGALNSQYKGMAARKRNDTHMYTKLLTPDHTSPTYSPNLLHHTSPTQISEPALAIAYHHIVCR